MSNAKAPAAVVASINANSHRLPRAIRSSKTALMAAACATAIAVAGARAQAASGTWLGTTDATWAGANWSATPVPGTGDTATFNGAGNGFTTIDLGTGVVINTVIFDTASAAYTIGAGTAGSQTLNLNDGGAITMNSAVANNEIINSTVTLGTAITGTYTITNNSANTLTFNGTIQGGTGGTAAAKTLNVGGTGNITFANVSNGGSSGNTIAKTGTGTLTLSGAADNVGTGLTLNGGVVLLNKTSSSGVHALGGGGFTLTTGTIQLAGTGGDQIYDGSTITSNGGIFDMNGLSETVNALNGGASGVITNNSAGTTTSILSVGGGTVATGGNGTYAGIFKDGPTAKIALAKGGTGTFILQGANTFSGGITINSGTLEINTATINALGSGTVNIGTTATNATLQFTGTTANFPAFSNPLVTGGTGTDTLSVTSWNPTFNGAVTLGNNLTILSSNTAGSAVTFTNAFGGVGNITTTVAPDGGKTSTITLAAVNMTGNILNNGTGTSSVILGGNIGSLVGSVTQSSATSPLVLSGTNTYTTGTIVNAGTLRATKVLSLPGQTTGGMISVLNSSTLAVNAGGTGEFAATDISNIFNNAAFALNTAHVGIDTTNAGGSFTYSPSISAPIGLTKLGTGTLVLSGNNTYSGSTLVSAGTLQIAQLVSLPGDNVSGRVAVAAAATLDLNVGGSGEFGAADITALLANASFAANTAVLAFDTTNAGGSFTYAPAITPAMALTKVGTGTLVLGGNNTYTGATNVNAGTLALTGSNASTQGALQVNSGGILQLQSNSGNTTGGTANVLGYTTGSATTAGSLALNSGSTLQLRSDSAVTFAGTNGIVGLSGATVTINVDQLTSAGTNNILAAMPNGSQVGNAVTLNVTGAHGYGLSLGQFDSVTGTTTLTFVPTTASVSVAGFGSTVATASTVVLDGTAAGNSIGTISNGTTAATAVTKQNSSIWTLNGSNTYTGATSISAGTLQLNGFAALPSASAVNLGSATLQVRDDGAGNNGTISHVGNNITLSAASTTDTIDVGNNGGTSTGNTVAFGALNNGTSGNAFLSTLNFTGANGYEVSFSAFGLPGSTGNTTTLNPTSTSVIITGPVTNQESGTLSSHYDTLTLGGSSTGNAVNGVISDNANYTSGLANGETRITMSGTGSWTLGGISPYHGPTVVNSGILNITGTLQNSSVTVTPTGTSAMLAGNGTITPLVTVSGLGKLAPSAVTGVPTGPSAPLTITGGVTFASTSVYSVNLVAPVGSASPSYDEVIIGSGGTATLGGATLLVNDGGYTHPVVGDQFWILDGLSGSNSVAGTFASGASVTGTSGVKYNIVYNSTSPTNPQDPQGSGHDVLLQVNQVPEPASIGLIAFAAAGLLARRRRRGA